VLFNVSTLLGEPVGAVRRHTVEAEWAPPAEPGAPAPAPGPLRGDVRLMRTGDGVLVLARLTVEAVLECARCLAPLRRPIEIGIEEEFLPERDPLTGVRLDDVDPDAFRIDARQHLDLSEAIRQYVQAALPISTLCRPDCAGLCPRCGADRNEAECGCPPEDNDQRWDALAALAGELRQEEERRGAPEA